MAGHIVILNGHPDQQRLCGALADRFQKGAEQHSSITRFDLADMAFDANLAHGYQQIQPLEEDLLALRQAITDCDHLVIVAPVWWGGIPARLKGLIDRTFLPGFAFRYEANQTLPTQLLTGRRATLLFTLDTPPWYFRWVQKAPAVYQLDKATLSFSGFRPVKTLLFGPVIKASEQRIDQWLQQAESLGLKAGVKGRS